MELASGTKTNLKNIVSKATFERHRFSRNVAVVWFCRRSLQQVTIPAAHSSHFAARTKRHYPARLKSAGWAAV